MNIAQPVNWVHVAQRLTRYINETGALYFENALQVIAYLDALEAADDGE